MKKLAELYEISKQENWISDAHDNCIYAQSDKCVLRVATVTRLADARLIAAMHNALPELLDAWEMVQALEWAEEWGKKEYDYRHQDGLDRPCDMCPMYGDMCGGTAFCDNPCHNREWYCRDEWLSAYREAQKNEGVE